jgi:alpha-glucoside transport system substrate-binding protein
MSGRWWIAAVCLLVLAGCTGGVGGAGSATRSDGLANSSCSAFTDYPRAPGTTVTFLVGELNQTEPPLESTWSDFTRCTGIRIINEVDRSTGADFLARIDAGRAPDLTVYAQPGGIADLVHRQKDVGVHPVVPAPPEVAANVDGYWNPAWRTYGSVDGVLYGAPFDSVAKSMVWYSPKRFAAAGYSVPTTWDELIALSDRIVADGKGKPWCGGLESGPATGWPATDWLEEIVLGGLGADVYDRWVAGLVKFDSPEIRSAMQVLDSWMHNPAYVNGGHGDVASIARTRFQDGGRTILDGTCFMYPFPWFYIGQWNLFKKDATIGPDGDIHAFAVPAVDPSLPPPVVGGGDFVIAFSDRPEVQTAQAYLSSSDWATRRATLAGVTSANTGVPLEVYDDPVSRLSVQMLTAPGSTFRFDGSDLMPQVVQEEEWKQLTAWFAEGKPTSAVLRAIDAAWPSGTPSSSSTAPSP